MNNSFLRDNDDGIGIDPTTLDIIESLDDPTPNDNNKNGKKSKAPKTKKEKKVNPDAKPGDGSKKFLLIVLVIALIVGVAYGIYWYLNLGTTSNAKKEKKYELLDKYVTVGDLLSESITDYGTFPGIDVKTCTLDTSEVDVESIGEYNYYITCDGIKYNAKIYVIDEPVFNITPIMAVTTVDGTIDPDSLYVSDENYSPVGFTTEEMENIVSSVGLKSIEFKLTNELGQTGTVKGLVLVLDNEYDKTLSCFSEELTSNDKNYTIGDIAYFDVNGNKIESVRKYHFTLDSEGLIEVIDGIKEDGTVTYNNVTGYAIVNKTSYTLDIIKKNTDIDSYTSYDGIKKYYTDTKKYTCDGELLPEEDD